MLTCTKIEFMTSDGHILNANCEAHFVHVRKREAAVVVEPLVEDELHRRHLAGLVLKLELQSVMSCRTERALRNLGVLFLLLLDLFLLASTKRSASLKTLKRAHRNLANDVHFAQLLKERNQVATCRKTMSD